MAGKTIIRDVIKYEGTFGLHKQFVASKAARNSLNHFYEQLCLDKIASLVEIDANLVSLLNETAPLLFTCLKLALVSSSSEPSLQTFSRLDSLDSFIEHDSA